MPGGQARLHHRDHDQIHVARGHWFGKLRLRKGPRRFIKAGKGSLLEDIGPCPVKIQFGETFNFEHKDSNTSYPGRGAPFLVTAQRIHIDADTIGKFGLCGASAQKNESIGDAAHGVSAPWRRSGLK